MKISTEKNYSFAPSNHFSIPSNLPKNTPENEIIRLAKPRTPIIKLADNFPNPTITQRSNTIKENSEITIDNTSVNKLSNLHTITKRHLNIRQKTIALKNMYGENHELYKREKAKENVSYNILQNIKKNSTKQPAINQLYAQISNSPNPFLHQLAENKPVTISTNISPTINQKLSIQEKIKQKINNLKAKFFHKPNLSNNNPITQPVDNQPSFSEIYTKLLPAKTTPPYFQIQKQINSHSTEPKTSSHNSVKTIQVISQPQNPLYNLASHAYQKTKQLKNGFFGQLKGLFQNHQI
jgi:hypothetical protein